MSFVRVILTMTHFVDILQYFIERNEKQKTAPISSIQEGSDAMERFHCYGVCAFFNKVVVFNHYFTGFCKFAEIKGQERIQHFFTCQVISSKYQGYTSAGRTNQPQGKIT